MYLIAASVILIIALVIYSNLRTPRASKKIETEGLEFPEGFLWATGEDAYQHEGGNMNNDWAAWEAGVPSPIENGDRCEKAADFWNRYEEDFTLAKSDGQNAHRIGIEWSRVEQVMGEYDEEALAHYEKMLKSMKDKGFTVFLNLWHFTLPNWAVEAGGWESEIVMVRWEEFVEECAIRFAWYVDYWSTMIDAQIYALNGYAVGEIPPNKKDQKASIKVYHHLIRAHAKAYKTIKECATIREEGRVKVPKVGQIYFFFDYQPKGFFIDRFVTHQLDKIFNWSFLDAVHTGKIDVGVFPGPKIKYFSEDTRDTLDWIGVNYYTRQIVSFNPTKPGMLEMKNCGKYPATDMGWEIYPEGMHRICKKIARRYPGVPLFIAESGLADAKDDRRPQFIIDHLAWVHKLIKEKLPVFGFTYWSLTDNWEWAKGFAPKFGLYRVDRKTFERTPTASAALYRFIAKNNRLPEKDELKEIIS